MIQGLVRPKAEIERNVDPPDHKAGTSTISARALASLLWKHIPISDTLPGGMSLKYDLSWICSKASSRRRPCP